jgi:peptide/nickel transport system permease protein
LVVFIARRVGAALIVLFLSSILIFIGIRALPGDPVLALSGEERDPVALEQTREKYGLDEPVPVQYVKWLGHALQGDLGESTRTGLEITPMIVERLPITLELAGLSVLIGLLLGIPAGVLAAVRRGFVADYTTTSIALVGISIPNFFLGLILILVFAVELNWLPASGYVPFFEDPIENLKRMIMPAFVLGTGLAAVVMRQVRSSMLESLGADYVRTARAKGLSEQVVVGVHALRNSLITVVTLVGLQMGALISGAVITEQIFVIPGFGKLTVDAIFERDFPLIQGVVLVAAAGYVIVNLAVDVVYSLINPRIRIAGRSS